MIIYILKTKERENVNIELWRGMIKMVLCMKRSSQNWWIKGLPQYALTPLLQSEPNSSGLNWLWAGVGQQSDFYSAHTEMEEGSQKPVKFLEVYKNMWTAYGTNYSYIPYAKPSFQ